MCKEKGWGLGCSPGIVFLNTIIIHNAKILSIAIYVYEILTKSVYIIWTRGCGGCKLLFLSYRAKVAIPKRQLKL